VEDERTHRVYVVVDQDTHRRAMEALTEREDMAAIQAGIDDMEAGRHRPLADVDAEIRIKHNIPRET
jgi:predicted transcriptional regulator